MGGAVSHYSVRSRSAAQFILKARGEAPATFDQEGAPQLLPGDTAPSGYGDSAFNKQQEQYSIKYIIV
jgi:hypothetical protein